MKYIRGYRLVYIQATPIWIIEGRKKLRWFQFWSQRCANSGRIMASYSLNLWHCLPNLDNIPHQKPYFRDKYRQNWFAKKRLFSWFSIHTHTHFLWWCWFFLSTYFHINCPFLMISVGKFTGSHQLDCRSFKLFTFSQF
jgi:hypothetical protein